MKLRLWSVLSTIALTAWVLLLPSALLPLDAQTRTPNQIQLQASQVSGIAATTLTRSTTTGLAACKTLSILMSITAGGTATGTLQIFLEDSSDGGTTWDDLVASNTFALGAAAITQRWFINGFLIPSLITSATPGVQTVLGSSTAAAVETLTAGSVRQGPFGDRLRVREKLSGPAGSPVGATYYIQAVCKA